jgi:cytoskeletal protein RodZ
LPSFGDKLKKEREKRAITLDDVSLTTKIGTRFLRALEEEHFDQLPGGIFNRGFVRAYARCVGLDENQTIADYLLASGEAPPQKAEVAEPVPGAKASAPKVAIAKEARAERAEPREHIRGAANFPWILAGVVMVVVVLALALWQLASRGPLAPRNAPSTDSATRTSTPPAPPTRESKTATVAPRAASPAPNSPPTPGSFTVVIKAKEDSWISITADGKPIFEDTLEPPAEKSVEAHREVVVKAGNVGGLDFMFGGKRLASLGEEGEVKTLTFDPNGLRSQARKPRPADASPSSP